VGHLKPSRFKKERDAKKAPKSRKKITKKVKKLRKKK